MIDFEGFKERYQEVPVEEHPNRVVETMPEPMVSVHVSTYQHADFIRDCMKGVLMQETDFPYEIIIGEDESDDGTREICKEYAEQYPEQIRLFLHRRENNIAVHGRPTGKFQVAYSHFMARGKYIAICEGDDYWTDPKKLQKQVGFLEAHPEYVMAYQTCVNRVVGGGHISDGDHPASEVIEYPKLLTLVYRNIFDVIPKSYFQIINGDTFLMLRLKRQGQSKCIRLLRPAVRRVHEGGMWSSLRMRERGVKGFDSCLRIYDCMEGTSSASEAKRELFQAFYRVVITFSPKNEISSEISRVADRFTELYQRDLGAEALIYTLRTLRTRLREKIAA